jgi:hypothetical protein
MLLLLLLLLWWRQPGALLGLRHHLLGRWHHRWWVLPHAWP